MHTGASRFVCLNPPVPDAWDAVLVYVTGYSDDCYTTHVVYDPNAYICLQKSGGLCMVSAAYFGSGNMCTVHPWV